MPNDLNLPEAGDPLAGYRHAAVVAGTTHPVPLTGTRYAVRIDGGLATVVAERAFRNAEAGTIEVTMTFPVPVHATLLGLEARIGDRTLKGQARRRDAARDTYEGAIDRGRTAVLHEEVLRGVHQVSVAHVPPGETVTVSGTWAMPLALAEGDAASLHIPVTVGDVFGRSPLPDSDDLVHGGLPQSAEIEVTCPDGRAGLVGAQLVDGRARVRLNAPIRIVVDGWRPGVLSGTAADGRTVSLEIVAASIGALPLDCAIVVDRSGSMGEVVVGDRRGGAGRSKLDVVVDALREAAVHVGGEDRVALWQFDDRVQHLRGATLDQAILALEGPGGGTQIGRAIATVLRGRPTRDVLLVTDGKSYALDVQEAARSGRRFHVVLIGEDALEAHVGHLAALTGGQVFIASGREAGSAVRQAFAAMRAARFAQPAIEGAPSAVEACIGGMRLRAAWRSDPAQSDAAPSRSVAAIAAALALPHMTETAAAALAEAEGIVCHLTSLVLVDGQGAVQEGIPAQRKVALETPMAAFAAPPVAYRMASLVDAADDDDRASVRFMRADRSSATRYLMMSVPLRPDPLGMILSLGLVDWSADPNGLRQGDLSSLTDCVAEAIRTAASLPEVVALADALGQPAVAVVVALLARAERSRNRSAARLARSVLAGAPRKLVAAAVQRLGF